MKYIISQSKLEKLIEKYLDSLDWESREEGNVKRLFLDGKLTMVSYTIIGGERMLTIFQNPFLNTLISLFSLKKELIWIIMNWYNKKMDDNCSQYEII